MPIFNILRYPSDVRNVLLIFLLTTITAPAQKPSKETINREINDLSDEKKVDHIIKNFYSIYSADFDNALALTKQASRISHKNGWKEKEAYSLMNEGVIHYLKGDYKNSLPRYINAYRIFDSLQDFRGLAKLNNEMAVFYNKQSEFKKAYEHIDKAIMFAGKINDLEDQGTSLDHKGFFLLRDGKPDESFAAYRRVYEIRLAQKDSVGLGYALLNFYSIEMARGNTVKALEYISQSTKIREEIQDDQGVAVNLVNTGEIYYAKKEYHRAIAYFNQSLARALQIGYSDLIQYDYQQLALSHIKMNDYKAAYDYQQKSQQVKDSLFSVDRAKAISELELKYETEKKEHQIALQQTQLSEQQAHIHFNYAIIAALVIAVGLIIALLFLVRSRLKRTREISVREAFIHATISSQEKERKRFAQDLHDGMGQLIFSLRMAIGSLDTQAGIEKRLDVMARSENILNDMHQEIRSIAFNLMPQHLIQYGLGPALKEMAQHINHKGNVTVTVSTFNLPLRFSEVQEISIYRIAQEWINNTMKYSNATKIEVHLVADDQEISVMIEDNGKGFDTATLENSQGNGWRNIQSRVKLIRGNLNIDSHPQRAGTTLSIEFPVPSHAPDVVDANTH